MSTRGDRGNEKKLKDGKHERHSQSYELDLDPRKANRNAKDKQLPPSRGRQQRDLTAFDDEASASPMSSTNIKARFATLQSAQVASNVKILDELNAASLNEELSLPDSEEDACIICLSGVTADDAVWQCKVCRVHSFHFTCIQRWIRDGVKEKGLDKSAFPLAEVYWKCPNCTTRFPMTLAPTQYVCFCGKTVEPKRDPWLPAHSCGQSCDRNLVPLCGHACSQPCHSGKCPPCSQTVSVTCFCGSNTSVRLCASRAWSCGHTCSKLLSCGVHTCSSVCHSGNCPPCDQISIRTCRCGKSSKSAPCSDGTWQCTDICGKPLSCGHHSCQEICHAGQCNPCSKAGPRSCYCGKRLVVRPCTEEVAESCNDSCNRLLACGVHLCPDRCHKGPCGPCRALVSKRCECQESAAKQMQCHMRFTCTRKCRVLRACGKHKCATRCCTLSTEEHERQDCSRQCDLPLRCGHHRCALPCHIGACPSCSKQILLVCACGQTQRSFPCMQRRILPHSVERSCKGKHSTRLVNCDIVELACDRPCGNLLACGNHSCSLQCHTVTKRRHLVNGRIEETESIAEDTCSPCTLKCSLFLKCGHICSSPCHLGPCPPCAPSNLCLKSELSCGHPCPIHCHEGSPCPPCESSTPCSKKELPCGHPCSKTCHLGPCPPCVLPIVCGKTIPGCDHTCPLFCHLGSCPPCSSQDRCNRSLSRCRHPCDLTCHTGDCPPCVEKVHIQCFCGVQRVSLACHELTSSDTSTVNIVRCCGRECALKFTSCPHLCTQLCHPPPCPSDSCVKKVTVRCKCGTQKAGMTCDRVRAVLEERGASAYSLSILDCDEACRKSLHPQSSDSPEKDIAEEVNADDASALRQRRGDSRGNSIMTGSEIVASRWRVPASLTSLSTRLNRYRVVKWARSNPLEASLRITGALSITAATVLWALQGFS